MTKGGVVPKRTSPDADLHTRPLKRRLQVVPNEIDAFGLSNLNHGEVVHYRCLLITGVCPVFENSKADVVSVQVKGHSNSTAARDWPVFNGRWKALVMLSPGKNEIEYRLHRSGGVACFRSVKVTYTPLTQNPAIHLAAILSRYPSYVGVTGVLQERLTKICGELRMNAYIWQALIAEDMRVKGLGRRSFRLQEEWALDTTREVGSITDDEGPLKDSIAKVYIAHSARPVAELYGVSGAAVNGYATNFEYRGNLRKSTDVLSNALTEYDSTRLLPEDSAVLSLILDHGLQSNLVNHSPCNLAEVPVEMLQPNARDLDSAAGFETNHPSDRPSGRYDRQSLQAHISQQLRASLNVPGLSYHGGTFFGLDRPGTGNGATQKDSLPTEVLDLQCALVFRRSPIFRVPGDDAKLATSGFASMQIKAWLDNDNDFHIPRGEDEPGDPEAAQDRLIIDSEAGIVRGIFYDTNGVFGGDFDYVSRHAKNGSLGCRQRSEKITAAKVANRKYAWILAANGHARIIDIEMLRHYSDRVRVPGTQVYLHRNAVRCSYAQRMYDGIAHPAFSSTPTKLEPWTILLTRRHPLYPVNQEIDHAAVIELRVGCLLDGIVVDFHYGDRAHSRPWIPTGGGPHSFGGHASQLRQLHPGDEIVRIEVSRQQGYDQFEGIRITLSSGEVWGELNRSDDAGGDIMVLEPPPGERVVGLCGLTGSDGLIKELGIVTIQEDLELPDAVYDMEELVRVRWPKAEIEDFDDDDEVYGECEQESQSTDTETLQGEEDMTYEVDADIAIPGSSFHLRKVSPRAAHILSTPDQQTQRPKRLTLAESVPWHILLDRSLASDKPRGETTKIDLRVGCSFDGIIVHQTDGSQTDSRPWPEHFQDYNHPLHVAGHASEAFYLPAESEIVRAEICEAGDWGWGSGLRGIRITLSTGESFGELNESPSCRVLALEPVSGQTVVGFYGLSFKGIGYLARFGLLTVGEEAGQLPKEILDLPEFARHDRGVRAE